MSSGTGRGSKGLPLTTGGGTGALPVSTRTRSLGDRRQSVGHLMIYSEHRERH